METAMFRLPCLAIGRLSCAAALATVVLHAANANGQAQFDAPNDADVPGRIDFDSANLPSASIELNLHQQTIKNLFNLGDAAIAGVVDALVESANSSHSSDGAQLAAEQLIAAREIIQFAGQLVQEVRVRVYTEPPDELVLRCEKQLDVRDWHTVMRGRDGGNSVQISILENETALRGVFIIAGEGRHVVLVNVACEASPERVKQLTSAAMKVALENGLGEVIETQMRKFRHRRSAPTQQAQHRDQH
jgi:hypothetical protein